MKSLPLLSLCLAVTVGVGCSNPAQESTPAAQQGPVKKRSQALSSVELREVPVSTAVLAAAGDNARVREFEVVSAEGTFTSDEVVAAALQQGASDPVSLPWQAGLTRDQDETRTSLRYLESLLPAIEAEVGTQEEYHTGYYHWFQAKTEDACDLGDLYTPYFAGSRKVFVIEATGTTEC